MQCLKRPEEGSRSLRTGVTDGSELGIKLVPSARAAVAFKHQAIAATPFLFLEFMGKRLFETEQKGRSHTSLNAARILDEIRQNNS